MILNNRDQNLIKIAKELVNPVEVSGGTIKNVGSALITTNGKVFTGVCLDLCCGIGFCAEHSAVADMISHSNETKILSIVAISNRILKPCGRCRELLQLVNKDNLENCNVIISEKEKVKLKDLLPSSWLED